ncbi:MAG: polyisoprenoid-binding protein [Candidatus Eremiobacteraeota bacterium]|nr:polyisoprenoid-binding protein [Candidatus Eremiobacteraeota bacterium]
MSTTTTVQTYAIDASHTNAEFVVRHLMIAKVRGRFAALAGTIDVPEGSDVPTSIQATLELESLTTSEAQRDAHLKSPDFFDAANHPQITFRSTSITPAGDELAVTGDLTIRGTTLPVVLKATFEGRTIDPWGNRRVGYEAHAKISRKDFGLTWNQALEAGGVAIGDEVKIELAVEAVAQ